MNERIVQYKGLKEGSNTAHIYTWPIVTVYSFDYAAEFIARHQDIIGAFQINGVDGYYRAVIIHTKDHIEFIRQQLQAHFVDEAPYAKLPSA